MCEACPGLADRLRSLDALAARLERVARVFEDDDVELSEQLSLLESEESDENGCTCLACRVRRAGGV